MIRADGGLSLMGGGDEEEQEEGELNDKEQAAHSHTQTLLAVHGIYY